MSWRDTIIKKQIWCDIGCGMPAKVPVELRFGSSPWYFDFHACTGDPEATEMVDALRKILDGEGGPANVKNEHGISVENPNAIVLSSATSGSFSLTLVPKRGWNFPWRKGVRVKLVSQVGGYTYDTRRLLQTCEALIATAAKGQKQR